MAGQTLSIFFPADPRRFLAKWWLAFSAQAVSSRRLAYLRAFLAVAGKSFSGYVVMEYGGWRARPPFRDKRRVAGDCRPGKSIIIPLRLVGES